MTFSAKGWTYGAEHEWGDIWRHISLPRGFKWDERDCTIVNSNGIANDPKGKLYAYGGEINTPPTGTIEAQVDHLSYLKEWWGDSELSPAPVVNYRSNLHCHIRVPGLSDDLIALKRFALYNAHWLPIVLPIIEPIPQPNMSDYLKPGEYRGALRRYKRRKRSHHTVLPPSRLFAQQGAATVAEFLAREVPISGSGAIMWHAQPRAAVNLRQLRETDTIEFRHFPGTLAEKELQHCFEWCQHYTLCALGTWVLPADVDPYQEFYPESVARALGRFPRFEPYNHRQELLYAATCHDGSLRKCQIERNIAAILANEFDVTEWEAVLKW